MSYLLSLILFNFRDVKYSRGELSWLQPYVQFKRFHNPIFSFFPRERLCNRPTQDAIIFPHSWQKSKCTNYLHLKSNHLPGKHLGQLRPKLLDSCNYLCFSSPLLCSVLLMLQPFISPLNFPTLWSKTITGPIFV